jgi:hypothetical protein
LTGLVTSTGIDAQETRTLLEVAIAEAERAVGSFDLPNTGLLMVLPVTQARGLHKAIVKTRSGHPISFRRWLRYGIPVTLMSLVLANIYLAQLYW